MLRLDGVMITRQHVVQLLPLMGLSEEDEQRLLALHYPVPFDVARAAFESVGVDMDVLVERMGAGP